MKKNSAYMRLKNSRGYHRWSLEKISNYMQYPYEDVRKAVNRLKKEGLWRTI